MFQALLDNSHNPVLVVDSKHCIIKANRAYAALSGISVDKLAGKALVQSQSAGSYRDLGGQLALTLLRMEGSERSDVITLEIAERSAQTFQVNAKQCSSDDGLFSGITVVLADISEQVEAQQRIDQTSAAMDDITEALSVTFFQLCREPNGHIWFPWVRGLQDAVWGWSAEKMMRDGGGIFPNLDNPEKGQFVEALDQSSINQTPVDLILWVAPHNRWVHLATGKPRSSVDGSVLWYGYAMDATSAQRYNALLTTARHEAEAAAEAKSRFVAAMSHEIRTPLAAVIASLDLLRDDELSLPQREELELADNSAKLLLDILGNILDFSKMEAGQLELEQAPLDLRQIIEDVLRVQARKIAEKGVSLEFYVDSSIATSLLGDAVRLQQIVLNLVGNAAKFTLQGNIVVRATLVADHPGTQTIHLEVSDTGIGIPMEKQEALFNAFVQADVSTTRRFGGSGLGLSICSRLVHVMGGTIVLTSVPGVGSTFRVQLTLPVAERSAQIPVLAGKRIAIAVSRADDAAVFREHAITLGMQPTFLEDLEPPDIAVIDIAPPPTWQAAGVSVISYGMHHDGLSGPPIWWSEFREACLTAVNRGDSRKPRAPVEEAATVQAAAGPLAGLTTLPILVAEDHVPFQIVIRRQIEKLGLTCNVVSDGKEALAALGQKRYGMVLTDCHMPYMDGYELTSAIRASESGQLQRLPVIALSADVSNGERQRGRTTGMDDFLLKPLKLADLRDCIERWVLR